jgi:tetratricopeptide (TPR) repeat protein
MRSGLVLCLLLSLAACGSTENPQPAQPADETLARHERAGDIASSLDRPDEAVIQYEAALRRAEARDDLPEIANLSFSLAVAQLRANRPEDALATATRARAEIERRGGSPMPALTLAEATAHYRTGNAAKADQMAAELQTGTTSEVADSASFLRGMIADDRNDEAGLSAALNRITDQTTPVRRADRQELEARLALRRDDASAARAAALEAAQIRQEIKDYRGMARALSVAALAAERAGDAEGAAGLYLRAGRSAAAQSDPATARPWLNRALKLTHDPETAEAVQAALKLLDEPQT